MKSPKVNVQTETPAEAAARAAEQQRAENTQIQETQGLNAAATVRRTRRFGKLFGNVGGGSGFGGSPAAGAALSGNRVVNALFGGGSAREELTAAKPWLFGRE